MRTLLFILVFWAGINDALLVAISTVVGSNELAAKTSGHPFLPSELAIAFSVFIAFAITLAKHIASWTVSVRQIVEEQKAAKAKETPGQSAPPPAVVVGLIFLIVLLCGCETVPRTLIAYDPANHTFQLESPKDLEMEGLRISVLPATATNSMAITLSIDTYRSKNNIEVIKAIAERNRDTREKLEATGRQLLGDAIDLMK